MMIIDEMSIDFNLCKSIIDRHQDRTCPKPVKDNDTITKTFTLRLDLRLWLGLLDRYFTYPDSLQTTLTFWCK